MFHQNAETYLRFLCRHIELAVHSNDRDVVKSLREQLQLLHQQQLFERHRRETHAFKNRRLLADAKNTRALEEYNSALVSLKVGGYLYEFRLKTD